jgi:biopolymer transport protein ExbD
MSEQKPTINVTPLIDILLVLLIIFMIISPNKLADFKTKIPAESDKKEVRPNPDSLIVKINSDATLNLNQETNLGSISEPTALISRLTEVFKIRQANLNVQKTVFIKAPKSLNYGEVIKVIDAVNLAGATTVALQTDNLN